MKESISCEEWCSKRPNELRRPGWRSKLMPRIARRKILVEALCSTAERWNVIYKHKILTLTAII